MEHAIKIFLKIIALLVIVVINTEVRAMQLEISSFPKKVPTLPQQGKVSIETTTESSQKSKVTKSKPVFPQKPEGITQTVPPSVGLLESSNPKNDSTNSKLEITTKEYLKPQTVLEYVPSTPFYHPHPVTLPPLVPTGKPWPESEGGYETKLPSSQQVSTSTTPKRTTEQNKEQQTTTEKYVKPQTVLEYVPSTPFYHPHPVTLPPLVPPGKPWPESAEGSVTKPSSVQSTFPPNLNERFPELTTINKETTTTSNTPVNKEQENIIKDYAKPLSVLEYKPITSFYHPNPITLPQIVPSGTPWPASAEGYETTKQTKPPTQKTTISPNLFDRFPELSTLTKRTTTPNILGDIEQKTTTVGNVKPQTVLEYKPITSFHHPNPVTIAQIIPPGKPLPESEGPQTKPSTASTSTTTTSFPNLFDRFPELVGTKTTTTKTTKSSTTTKAPVTTSTAALETTSLTTRIVLTYKPQRPWYVPNPGVTVGQIIKPGKPWPDSPAGYPSFGGNTRRPSLKDSDDSELDINSHSKLEELQSLKEEPNLEPNALQYYGPKITAPPRFVSPATPFTSGTQKTTLSDIIDILKEVHNITIVSGSTPPSPSHLLPFDVDKGYPVSSTIVRPPPRQNYGDVIRRQKSQPEEQASNVHVYDGTMTNAGRIFPNPKFVRNQ